MTRPRVRDADAFGRAGGARRKDVAMSPPAAPRRRRCPRRHAFTLVGLLVVIGLVALLMSVLLPSLSAARKRAMRVKLEAEARQSAIAAAAAVATSPASVAPATRPARPLAHVKSF